MSAQSVALVSFEFCGFVLWSSCFVHCPKWVVFRSPITPPMLLLMPSMPRPPPFQGIRFLPRALWAIVRRSVRFARMLKAALLLTLCGATLAAPRYFVMPWLCLERCGDDINAEMAEIEAHAKQLNAVSYEAFDLGLAADGVTPTLINNNFTVVWPKLRELGLKTYPMITTVDINKLRALFKNVRVPAVEFA